MVSLRRALFEWSGGRLAAFAVPEVATILFSSGAMSHGTFAEFDAAEYRAFATQAEALQIALEELWAQGAEAALRSAPRAERAVLLADRDAVDFKAWTGPVDPTQFVKWPDLLPAIGALVGMPGLNEAELVHRYQLGVLILQSFAVVGGRLNTLGYNAKCVGPNSTNPVRRHTAEQSQSNDEVIVKAYREAYPEDAICHITNEGDDIEEKLDAAARCVWRQVVRLDAASAASSQ